MRTKSVFRRDLEFGIGRRALISAPGIMEILRNHGGIFLQQVYNRI